MVNRNLTSILQKFIDDSQKEFLNRDDKLWVQDFFNEDNGGYLVISKERIEQSKLSKNEEDKYNKEYGMCITLAQNGYKIEYLKMTDGGFDIYLNGISADLKKTKSHNNIVNYAKKSIRNQGADIVVFEFEIETKEIYANLEYLSQINIHGYYYFTNKNTVYKF